MEKTKSLVKNVVLVIFISFLSISALADEKNDLEYKSPNYSLEYIGKDRLEGFNRLMFRVNNVLNDYIVYPVDVLWASVMPKYGIDRVDSVLDNAGYPKRFVSSLFQADLKCSGKETARFLTNSTLGLGGMYDPAENWLNIDQCNENLAQAFAKWGIGRGYYLYLPFIGPTNVRNGIAGALESVLNPETYIPYAPVIISVKSSRVLNKTTKFQPAIDLINETYADPYEITKQFYGLSSYFYENNLDRDDVFKEKDRQINPESNNKKCLLNKGCKISGVEFKSYNSQGSLVDSLRSTAFDRQPKKKSFWHDISIWNRQFNDLFKSSSVRISEGAPEYEYRYILNKNKNSPLAIIYPSIGENIKSAQATSLAEILYKNGYSVLLMSSVFDWKFVRSMPHSYKPGISPVDAKYLRRATTRVLNKITEESKREFKKKIIVSTSLGAMHALFMASQEEKNDLLSISRYICISPPVDMLHAINTIDSFIANWKGLDAETLKLKTALAAKKAQEICGKKYKCDNEVSMPFNDDEAKLIISFIVKQKLSDLIMTMEQEALLDKSELYDQILRMDFNDYINKYILTKTTKDLKTLNYQSSLYSIHESVRKNPKIRIFIAKDDYLLKPGHLNWLIDTANDKTTLFSNGSHLGFLYKKKFKDEFIKAINLDL